jgi:hypothetical protein
VDGNKAAALAALIDAALWHGYALKLEVVVAAAADRPSSLHRAVASFHERYDGLQSSDVRSQVDYAIRALNFDFPRIDQKHRVQRTPKRFKNQKVSVGLLHRALLVD